MEIFLFYKRGKELGNKKRVGFVKGSSVLVHSPEVWEHPPSREHTRMGTSPTT
jgi:hypothetical protein